MDSSNPLVRTAREGEEIIPEPDGSRFARWSAEVGYDSVEFEGNVMLSEGRKG